MHPVTCSLIKSVTTEHIMSLFSSVPSCVQHALTCVMLLVYPQPFLKSTACKQWRGKWIIGGRGIGAVARHCGRGKAEGHGKQRARCWWCDSSCRDKPSPQGVSRQTQIQNAGLSGKWLETGRSIKNLTRCDIHLFNSIYFFNYLLYKIWACDAFMVGYFLPTFKKSNFKILEIFSQIVGYYILQTEIFLFLHVKQPKIS